MFEVRKNSMTLNLCLAAGLCLATTSFAQEAAEKATESAAKPRVLDGPPAALAFKNETVERIVPFITEVTGKVVIPQPDVLTRKITVLCQQPIPRERALDMLILAMYQNGITVVEGPTVVTLRDIGEVIRQDVPVIGPDESVLNRSDMGTVVEKVFPLRNLTAENVGDMLKDVVPDFAKRSVDEESNQIAVIGNIGLLQRLERLITALDRPSAGALQTRTYLLRYSDAELIRGNIEQLFAGGSTTSSQNRNRTNNQNNQGGGRGGFVFPGMQSGGGTEGAAAATNSEVRVTANTQQNSVTVAADPAILDQIATQITEYWDLPVRMETVIPKTYELQNTDPIKMKTLLEGLFGSASGGGTTTTVAGGGGNRGGGQTTTTTSGAAQGVGRLAGQFSFEAIPDTSRLVVVSKSPDNMAVIDKIIADLDKPQTAGLPLIIELKHASAEDLAEQLNALLSQDGTLAQIQRASSGLSEDASSASPFATATTTTGTDGGTTNEVTSAGTLRFWWERSRPPTDRRNASNLVGQLRIVPVWRQNALMVVAPPEYRQSVADLVSQLDKPGRQVLLSAIVAEVSAEDAKSFGIRWSSQQINPTNPDNSISIGNSAEGTRNNFATSLFDTSVLNTDVNLNVLLQALAQKTDVSILSEPRIFTSDNQEAEFFDGQDIPFITDSQTNQEGNLVQSFDYKAVGIQMRIRPRITVKRDVDLKVNLELSSIVPGETLFGGFVVDRRETTTQLIVKDKQTIVISGILRSEDSDVEYKVPLLGDIPLLGYLFKSKERTKKNTELLVFITPVVVDNTDQSDGLNAPYTERLKALRGELDPENKHQMSNDPAEPAPTESAPASTENKSE
ncbi:MAG: secretin N-terminal domain-containing protein [Phycisphaerales bacterium]|jgi:general secretion pathway protein D